MGQHYDTLVELVSGFIPSQDLLKTGENVRDYLSSITKNAKLLDEQLIADEIKDALGFDDQVYFRFLNDFLAKSREKYQCIRTPHHTTAFEDEISVVIFDRNGANKGRVTICQNEIVPVDDVPKPVRSLLVADISDIDIPAPFTSAMDVKIRYSYMLSGGKRMFLSQEREHLEGVANHIAQSVLSYICQAAYHVHPRDGYKARLN